MNEIERYSVITEKNPREIVLLRGAGCAWKRCRFCDYHLDCSPDQKANFALNRRVLARVTGEYHRLEVINSGSFVDLDEETMENIVDLCLERHIHTLHFECHWMHRSQIPPLKSHLAMLGIALKIKIGVETFDPLFRECYLCKGIDCDASPLDISRFFDEVCLLQGLPGQTAASMRRDIETGLSYFERVCVNIMEENSTPIKPDPGVIEIFQKDVMPLFIHNPRVDILLHNTDFGVGGIQNEK